MYGPRALSRSKSSWAGPLGSHIDADARRGRVSQEDIMTKVAAQLSSSKEHMLLHELNHRTNTEFAAAISVVSLAAARSGNEDVKTALAAVTELLHHYADVHRALQMPEYDTLLDAAAYLRQLCFSISRSHLAYRKIKLVLATDPLQLRADRCRRLGMIVYELIVNPARHAFGRREGEIRVELLTAGAFVECSVRDNGSAGAVGSGRGLKIIDDLIKSLQGTFMQKFASTGSSSILIFPLRRIFPHAGSSERSPRPSTQKGIAQISEEIPTGSERVHTKSFATCGVGQW
jgi:two-component sensor histidine kinase